MTSPDGWITCELQSNYKYENLKLTKSSIDRKKKEIKTWVLINETMRFGVLISAKVLVGSFPTISLSRISDGQFGS